MNPLVYFTVLPMALGLAAVVGYALEMSGNRRAGRVALWAILVIGAALAYVLARWL